MNTSTRFCSLFLLFLLLAGGAAAQEESHGDLRAVAVSLARTLAAADARLLVAQAVAERSGRLYLANLLDNQLADGALFGERLDAAYRAILEEKLIDAPFADVVTLFAAMPGIELFGALGIEIWDPAAERPYVGVLVQGPDADVVVSEAFDGDGKAILIDLAQYSGFPVLVLELHDLSE